MKTVDLTDVIKMKRTAPGFIPELFETLKALEPGKCLEVLVAELEGRTPKKFRAQLTMRCITVSPTHKLCMRDKVDTLYLWLEPREPKP
jgi:hypothetical protein